MVTRAPTTSGGHNEQGNDENETDRKSKERHQGDARPDTGGEVSALHPTPCANDDGEECHDTECDDRADDGGEDTFKAAGRWNFAL